MCPVSLRTSQYCPPHPTPPPDFCFLRKLPSYFRNYYFHFLDPEDQVACTSSECMSDTTRIYLHPVSQTTAGLGANLEPQRAQVGGKWFGFSTRDTSHPTSLPFFSSQVKEAMQRIHDRGNIGKLILDVEKAPTPLVSQKKRDPFNTRGSIRCWHRSGRGIYKQFWLAQQTRVIKLLCK